MSKKFSMVVKRLKNSPVDPYKKDMTSPEMRLYDFNRTPNNLPAMSPEDARNTATGGRLREINPEDIGGTSEMEKLRAVVKRMRKK